MNYEEILNAQDGSATHSEALPFGAFYRKLVGKKYRYVLELKPELADNIVFCQALKAEQERVAQMRSPQQLQYEWHADGKVCEIEIEQGSFQTFAQLIDNTPAVVAQPGFIDSTVASLFDFVCQLNEQGIYHLCFAPQNVFTRKGGVPALLFHGSSFSVMSNLPELYRGFEQFVAPEVISGEGMDNRSDVYSLGRFIEWLYQHGEMPYEYKRVVSRATHEDPDQRYGSVDDMKKALTQQRSLKQSVLMFAGALLVTLLCVGLYFELMPKTEDIEFVQGVESEESDDILDDGINPLTELGVWGEPGNDDSLSVDERRQMDMFQAKAEQIFKKRFEKEAERIFSTMYSKDRMSLSEATYVHSNNAMAQKLLEIQADLANQTGIKEEKAEKIAAEIIDRMTAEKQKQVVRYGIQKDNDNQ